VVNFFDDVPELVESHSVSSRLTTQAQRPGPQRRPIATGARGPGSLQRMVRRRGHLVCSNTCSTRDGYNAGFGDAFGSLAWDSHRCWYRRIALTLIGSASNPAGEIVGESLCEKGTKSVDVERPLARSNAGSISSSRGLTQITLFVRTVLAAGVLSAAKVATAESSKLRMVVIFIACALAA